MKRSSTEIVHRSKKPKVSDELRVINKINKNDENMSSRKDEQPNATDTHRDIQLWIEIIEHLARTGESMQNNLSNDKQALQKLTETAANIKGSRDQDRLIDACTSILTKYPDKLQNAKRRAVRLILTMAQKHSNTCRDATSSLVRIITEGDHNKRVLSACKAAMDTLFATYPMLVATYIKDEATRLTQTSKTTRDATIQKLREWQLRASKHLGRAPIGPKKWQEVIEAVQRNKGAENKWHDEWAPENGRVQWIDEDAQEAEPHTRCSGMPTAYAQDGAREN